MNFEQFYDMDTDFRRESDYLDGLNDKQRQAVEHVNGPLLVLAGAGTGKTKVLTSRIAHLLVDNVAMPSNILAVTFTNKAAKEMNERVRSMVGGAAEGLWIGTFHSIAAKILRVNAELVGLRSNFTIIDYDDQVRLVKQIMSEMEIDIKETPPKTVLSVIQGYKDQALTPPKVSMNHVPKRLAEGKIHQIYIEYQERLLRANAADFGDLLLHNIELFNHNIDRLQQYQERFKYILVDEYQDTNIAQYLWLRLLAQKYKNIACVGDEDQSIYGWRGAEIGNILKFSKDFEGAEVIRLEQNYRSTNQILSVASTIIANNTERLGKTLWTEHEAGVPVKLIKYNSNYDEAKFTVREIEDLVRNHNIKPSNIAILVRAAYQTRNFESEFINSGVPYRVVGGLRFYERKEIKDIISYMRVIIQPDDDFAFERIINTPKRGIGQGTMQKIFKTASENKISLFKASVAMCTAGAFSPRISTKLASLTEDILRWGKLRENLHHAVLTRLVGEESGYIKMLEDENTIEADARIENIKELIGALDDFEGLQAFLEHISLVTDSEESVDGDMVSIMTIHASKGLEFPFLFLPGWDDGVFPNQRAIDESGNKGLEEERRLAYVAITRARESLYISHTLSRSQFGDMQPSIPSRFITEMPEECIETIDKSYGLGYGQGYGSDSSYDRSEGRNKKKTHYQRYLEKQQQSKQAFGAYMESDYVSVSKDKGFEINQRVVHQKFGNGTVVSVEGDVVKVLFDKMGVKTLKESFLEAYG